MSLIPLLAKIIFYGLMLILTVFSVVMIYALLRFGKSKVLGLVLSAFYILLITSLYAAAQSGFNNLPLSSL